MTLSAGSVALGFASWAQDPVAPTVTWMPPPLDWLRVPLERLRVPLEVLRVAPVGTEVSRVPSRCACGEGELCLAVDEVLGIGGAGEAARFSVVG